MSIDPWWLFLSVIISGVGLGFFLYGKKQTRVPHLAAGLILMLYTYVVTSAVWMVVIALVILAGLWLAIRWGW